MAELSPTASPAPGAVDDDEPSAGGREAGGVKHVVRSRAERALQRGDGGEPWPTAAMPVENHCCSCKL